MHMQYYDTVSNTVNTWQAQSAPSERFPYGLGLDDDAYLVGLGIYPFREDKPEYDSRTQTLVANGGPTTGELEAVQHYRVEALSVEVVTKAYADEVRAERDQRIAVTDYLFMPDYKLTEKATADWTAYRTALRDITVQPGFPWTGAASAPWPMAPGA